MESSEYSAFESFKPKNILGNSSSKPSTSLPSDTKSQLHGAPTPEKPVNPPRRIRNRGAALSLKQVREAAQQLRKSDTGPPARPDPLMASAKEQIPLWPESSPAKLKKSDTSFKLPEKYGILDKFFSSLDTSIRLLRMKGSVTTFTNVGPKIEYLTDRFTYSHLAQLKSILPEAIEIKKILMHDERTNCMKPDLHLALNAKAIEIDGKMKSESGNFQLRKVFRTRLFDFFKAHPEGDEIPEEVLPEPFNRSKMDLPTNVPRTSYSFSVRETQRVAPSEQQPSATSHLSQSFRRHFSQKVIVPNALETNQEEAVVSGHAALPAVSGSDHSQSNPEKSCISAAVSPIKFSTMPIGNVGCTPNGASLAGLPLSPLLATPVKDTSSCQSVESSSKATAASRGTPAQSASTPSSATPMLQPPKRCYMSPDDGLIQSPNKLVRRPSRSRSLKFDTPVKNANIEDDAEESSSSYFDSDIFDILPENLLQSIKEKEKKALLEQDPAISQAKRRQQMIAGLPKLFDMIYFLFQSIRRSVILKEELMHKIVSNHLDIVDRREVEEQLRLLQELVPEWIYEKSASSGDRLLCVNKMSSPEVVRTRLAEAK